MIPDPVSGSYYKYTCTVNIYTCVHVHTRYIHVLVQACTGTCTMMLFVYIHCTSTVQSARVFRRGAGGRVSVSRPLPTGVVQPRRLPRPDEPRGASISRQPPPTSGPSGQPADGRTAGTYVSWCACNMSCACTHVHVHMHVLMHVLMLFTCTYACIDVVYVITCMCEVCMYFRVFLLMLFA